MLFLPYLDGMFRIFIALLLLSSCKPFQKIHRDAFVVDTHNDLLSSVTLQGMNIEENLKGKTHSDLRRLKSGGVDLQVFSIFCDEKYGNGTAYKYAIREMDSVAAIAARNPSRLRMVPAGERPLKGVNYIQGMTGVEGGHMIEDEIAHIDSFYRRGAKYLTLTWNNSVSWASSAKDESSNNLQGRKAGLNEFGEKVVKKLNELNMFVDVSHIGEKTFWDVMRVTTKPVIASHSSVYALCPVPRNLNDEQIKAIAKNGGVIHINLYSGFLDSSYRKHLELFQQRHKAEVDSVRAANGASYDINTVLSRRYPAEANAIRPPLSLVIEHINYIVRLVGVDHVGIGSDFDGIESTPLGLDGVQDLPLITKALLKEGYSKEDIRKILGGNFLRLLQ